MNILILLSDLQPLTLGSTRPHTIPYLTSQPAFFHQLWPTGGSTWRSRGSISKLSNPTCWQY